MPNSTRILLADDHPLIREGIGNTLSKRDGLTLAGVATNGHEVIELVAELAPDVLLLDLQMPGPPSLEIIKTLHSEYPNTRVLVLSAYDDLVPVQALLRAGVRGYVLKDEAIAVLVQAIRTVEMGGIWFSQAIASQLAKRNTAPEFTQRENDVLTILASGASNERIAQHLAVTERTVRFHLKNIYRKVGVHSRGEAIAWAVRAGYGKTRPS